MRKRKAALILLVVMIILGNISCTGEKSTLTVWHTETNDKTIAVLDAMGKEFSKKRPDIIVQFEAVNWNELTQRLDLALKTNKTPDLSHIQPNMGASLFSRNCLVPLDDVIESIGENEIHEQVRDVLKFDGHRYGIPHAMGTSLIVYRRDLLLGKNLQDPKTWAEFLFVIRRLQEDHDDRAQKEFYGIDIPGGENHFMNCLFSMLVASNGGRFFNEALEPTLDEEPIIQALNYFRAISELAKPGWAERRYMNTLESIATESVACIYFGSPRAIEYIEQLADPGKRASDVFAVLPDPHGPSGKLGYAQLDCENWVIFKDSQHQKEAKEFLNFFYERNNYLDYCLSVPIHLTPILKSMRTAPELLENPRIKKWFSWYGQIQDKIDGGTCQPITLVAEKDDLLIPFLMPFAESGIIRDMMMDVATNGMTAKESAAKAQQRTGSFLKEWRD